MNKPNKNLIRLFIYLIIFIITNIMAIDLINNSYVLFIFILGIYWTFSFLIMIMFAKRIIIYKKGE